MLVSVQIEIAHRLTALQEPRRHPFKMKHGPQARLAARLDIPYEGIVFCVKDHFHGDICHVIHLRKALLYTSKEVA